MNECSHEWEGPDYICSKCGAVCSKSAPLWVWELSGLSSGPRTVLLALWTVADRNTAKPRPVYPGNKLLRRRSNNISASTLYQHLAELKRLGWIRLVEDGDHRRDFELAWLTPFPESERTMPETKSEIPERASETSDLRDPGAGIRDPGDKVRDPVAQGSGSRTHTDQDLGTTHEQDHGAGSQREFALSSPKRDPIAEVLELFNKAKQECASWAGLPRLTGATDSAANRKLIRKRLASYPNPDLGVEACRKVIDVQVAQARSHGRARSDTPQERKVLKSQSGWKYFAISTLFAENNFDRWLERWDPDGHHQLWAHKDDRSVPRQHLQAQDQQTASTIQRTPEPDYDNSIIMERRR